MIATERQSNSFRLQNVTQISEKNEVPDGQSDKAPGFWFGRDTIFLLEPQDYCCTFFDIPFNCASERIILEAYGFCQINGLYLIRFVHD
jgi:hypothetical protein